MQSADVHVLDYLWRSRLKNKGHVVKLIAGLVLAFSIFFFYTITSAPRLNVNEFTYDDLLAAIRNGRALRVEIRGKTIATTLSEQDAKGKEAAKGKPKSTQISVGRLPGIPETDLVRELDSAHVKFSGYPDSGNGWSEALLLFGLPLLLLSLVYFSNFKRLGQSGALSFGKNRAKIHDQSAHIDVRFEDVAGVDEAKAELIEIVDFLKTPEKYQRLGGRIPRGVLLVGSPGTGKTLLAKAVAGEAAVAFFSISGSEFVEMFVGVGAARVRDLFEQAKMKAPCIVFIDELDAVGKSRTTGRGLQGMNDEREQTLNQLLVEMDGFDTSKGVIIMAATNAPELLDPALVRPGRFDRQVVIDRPDLAGREAILKVHARSVKMADKADLSTIAARTPGMVGSDLANVVNEAALLAAQRNANAVEMRDLEEAIDRAILGFEKRTRVMNSEEKRRVAYHEVGHALVALSLENADPVHRVSIIPRSVSALGYTLQLPTQERYLLTKPEIEDRIAVMLGGRGAEEIAFHGVVSTGAADDLQKASALLRQMVTRFGMSERMGQLTYEHTPNSAFLPTTASMDEQLYSDNTAEMIDEEVRSISDHIYHRVQSILSRRLEDLRVVAEAIVQKETLTRAEIDALISKKEAGRRKAPVMEEQIQA